ncbi:MAG: sugar nucleotide-binding protein, partial [Lachnospiraceae bacterium]|nr:sugar nucleotide-binding protein [Lachnospiraceae bacterium]
MKKILITGCNGQLGRAIQKEYGDTVTFIRTDMVAGDGVEALDITDLEAIREIAKRTKPDGIINCAAYTNVDGCETNEEVAYAANAIGPKNLAIVAKEIGAKLFHISTDYVF